MTISGHFIKSSKGRVFVSQFGEHAGETAVLCLPSIIEELNMARAVLAKQCQSYASLGTDSFIMDYYGTGDSEGEFEDASVNDWLEDILAVGRWLVSRGYSKLILLGVRVGGLFASAFQEKLYEHLPIQGQILWKPVTSGKVFVSQLIRIKSANQMMNNGEKTNWRNEILAGNDTEVAGYIITDDFIKGIEELAITTDTDWLTPTHWLELGSSSLTPATKRLTQHTNSISTHCLDTPQFWQVPEVFDLPELTAIGNKIIELRQEG